MCAAKSLLLEQVCSDVNQLHGDGDVVPVRLSHSGTLDVAGFRVLDLMLSLRFVRFSLGVCGVHVHDLISCFLVFAHALD